MSSTKRSGVIVGATAPGSLARWVRPLPRWSQWTTVKYSSSGRVAQQRDQGGDRQPALPRGASARSRTGVHAASLRAPVHGSDHGAGGGGNRPSTVAARACPPMLSARSAGSVRVDALERLGEAVLGLRAALEVDAFD